MNRTEIGILLALPGLLAIIVFSPWIIQILYSAKFTEAAELPLVRCRHVRAGRLLAPRFCHAGKGRGQMVRNHGNHVCVSAIATRMVWAPILRADRRRRWICSHVFLLHHETGVLWVARRLSEFTWSKRTIGLLLVSGGLMATAFLLTHLATEILGVLMGGFLSAATSAYCSASSVPAWGERTVSRSSSSACL